VLRCVHLFLRLEIHSRSRASHSKCQENETNKKQMKGLSLEEINELFGDPVAVHITHADKQETEEIDRRIENFDIKSTDLGESTPPAHVEDNREQKV
jgi:hypothetical protein